MFTDASRTVNFDPSTSCHYTPTSAVSTFNWFDRKKIYTSNAKRLMCIILKRSFVVYFVKSLNPH